MTRFLESSKIHSSSHAKVDAVREPPPPPCHLQKEEEKKSANCKADWGSPRHLRVLTYATNGSWRVGLSRLGWKALGSLATHGRVCSRNYEKPASAIESEAVAGSRLFLDGTIPCSRMASWNTSPTRASLGSLNGEVLSATRGSILMVLTRFRRSGA